MERPDWNPGDRLLSVREVAGIAIESAQEVFYDSRRWLGQKLSQIDEWLADFGD